MKVYVLIKKKPYELVDIYADKQQAFEATKIDVNNFFIIEKEVIYKDTQMKSMKELDKKVYEPKHFNDLMPFGKYKGRTIGDIIQYDPNYLLWCCDNLSFEVDEECLDLINCSINKEK